MADLTVLSSPVAALRDDRERVFAEQYAKHGDAFKALIAAKIANPAYPRHIIAEQLLAEPRIKAAIEAFKQVKPKRREVRLTRDSLIADIEDVFEKAMGKEDYTNALKAKQEQAQLLGLRVEKREVTVTADPQQMTTADLKKMFLEMKRQQESGMIDVTPKAPDGQPA